MSCLAMLPSNAKSLLRGINDNVDIPGYEQDEVARAAQAISSGVLRAPVPFRANTGLLESIMVAQEQERRRNFLLDSMSRAAMGSQSFLSSSDAGAILRAERQRALLLLGGGGMFGGGGGLLGGYQGHLGALGGLHGFERGNSLGSFTANSPGIGTHLSPYGVFSESTIDARLSVPEAPTGEPLRPSSPVTFLRTVRQQRGSRPASLAGDSIILDAMERQCRKGRTGTFPQKLYKALTDLEAEGRTNIASWLPDGSAFMISNPKAFDEDVMKKYFRMNHFSSFQRQCNLYEFGRVTEGPDKGAYFHELFHRGHPILASQIRRNKIKGETNSTGVKAECIASPSMPARGSTVDGIVSSFLKSRRRAGSVTGAMDEPTLERAASIASDNISESDDN